MNPIIRISLSALLLAPLCAVAEDAPVQVSGTISTGARAVDNDTNSSKFTEYRDLDDQAFVPRLTLDVFDPKTRRYFEFAGQNVSLADQRLFGRVGELDRWKASVDWVDVPHNFSNKAQTPYLRRGPGLLEVPSNVGITFKKLATAAADAPGVLASDLLIAAYQAGALGPTPLATQNAFGRLAFEYSAVDDLKLGVQYDRRGREGLKVGYGPIGDRPPRTLGVQLPEPVDHLNQDLTLSAEWARDRFQAQLSYVYSDFANAIDTLTWENLYATQAPGATTDVWDRAVSTYGRRPLAPDNRSHTVQAAFSVELPKDSLLSATLAYGRLEQDQELLPYSYNSDVLVNRTLPRSSADARMTTVQALVDYVVALGSRGDLRAYVRHFGLDNETPEAQWQYVTSDTPNTNGTVSFKNQRVNLAYAQDRTGAGATATFRLKGAWNGSLGLGYAWDSVDRDYREADTDEHSFVATFRARPAKWARLRASYTYGQRDGDYDPFVTRQSYWYPQSAATDLDNPALSFSNHPDMVRYDVSDRLRHRAEASLSLTPKDTWSLTGSVRYTKDDFDSDVQPWVATVGQVGATSPGDQLGLLEQQSLRFALDGVWMPTERATLNAFVSWNAGASLQRSLEYNENNKLNPSTVATAELGPWTRASSQWTADFDDVALTAGLGAEFKLRDRVTLSAHYTASITDIELLYSGYGVTNWDGTPYPANHQFGFPQDPPVINQDWHVVDVRLEFPVIRDLMATVGYGYERYRTDDWQQSAGQSWSESVGSEFLVRDSSRSHQWGNRFFNLGSYLAPSYDAHVAWAAFTYRF